MFQNRVRTAALAGAIAVATGVSGLTVPANAQETNSAAIADAQNHQNGLGLNKADGSETQANGTVFEPKTVDGRRVAAETQLKDALDKTAELLQDEGEDRAAARGKFVDLIASSGVNGGALDPSEKAVRDALAERGAEITAELEAAVKNAQDINATLQAARADDEAAADAWKEYQDAVNALNNVAVTAEEAETINGILKELRDGYIRKGDGSKANFDNDGRKINQTTRTVPAADIYPGATLTKQGKDKDGNQAGSTLKDLLDYFEWYDFRLGKQNPDYEDGNYITREHQLRVDELKALAFNGRYDEAKKAADAALAAYNQANQQAERRDAIVLLILQQRAYAQINLLRALEADYDLMARYIDLYENDTLTDGDRSTVRKEYRKAIEKLESGYIDRRIDALGTQDEKLDDEWLTWFSDEANSKPESERYLQEKRDFAAGAVYTETFGDAAWKDDVAYAREIDAKYAKQAEERKAAEEEAKRIAEQAEKDRQEAIAREKERDELLKQLVESMQNRGGNGDASNNTSNQDNDSSSTGSHNNGGKKLSTAAIIGIVLGVIAALGGIVAFAFPQIQQFLP